MTRLATPVGATIGAVAGVAVVTASALGRAIAEVAAGGAIVLPPAAVFLVPPATAAVVAAVTAVVVGAVVLTGFRLVRASPRAVAAFRVGFSAVLLVLIVVGAVLAFEAADPQGADPLPTALAGLARDPLALLLVLLVIFARVRPPTAEGPPVGEPGQDSGTG